MNSPETEKFSWRKRARSFRYAFAGMRSLIRSEHNARIHLAAAIVAVAAGWWLHISPMQWCVIILCIGVVFAAEAFNSAVEALADLVSPEYHPLVRKAKDIAAAAVLFLAIASFAVGLIIFLPPIISLIRG